MDATISQQVKLKLEHLEKWKIDRVSREENSWIVALVRVVASLATDQVITLLVYYQSEPSILEKEQVC